MSAAQPLDIPQVDLEPQPLSPEAVLVTRVDGVVGPGTAEDHLVVAAAAVDVVVPGRERDRVVARPELDPVVPGRVGDGVVRRPGRDPLVAGPGPEVDRVVAGADLGVDVLRQERVATGRAGDLDIVVARGREGVLRGVGRQHGGPVGVEDVYGLAGRVGAQVDGLVRDLGRDPEHVDVAGVVDDPALAVAVDQASQVVAGQVDQVRLVVDLPLVVVVLENEVPLVEPDRLDVVEGIGPERFCRGPGDRGDGQRPGRGVGYPGALEVLLVAPVDDRVVAGATAYDIVAVAAPDGVVSRPAVDRVGTGQAVDFVRRRGTVEGVIVTLGAIDPVQ